MATTQPVHFREDSVVYQRTKKILADEKISLTDVLNAALRNISNEWVKILFCEKLRFRFMNFSREGFVVK